MQDSENPLVSIIIPTFRRANYLERAIRSALSQTYRNIEVIVVNDNNLETEDFNYVQTITESLCDTRVKVISNDGNRGGGFARNNGFKNSNGDFIAFLDDDDQYYPRKIEAQVNYLKSYSEYHACYTGNEYKYSTGTRKYIKPIEGDITIPLVELKTRTAAGSSLMATRLSFEVTGGFNIELKRYQDWDFMLRFLKDFKIGCVPEVLVSIDMSSRINVGTCEEIIENKFIFLNIINDYIPKKQQLQIHNLHKVDLAIQLLGLKCLKSSFLYLLKGRRAFINYPVLIMRFSYNLLRCII
jgi:glycosyltransferase involved in cell wall biosynthesis